MEQELKVKLPLDTDGFLSQECPECERLFKIQYKQGSGKMLSHCPYCSHEGTGCWWTKPQAKYISASMSKQFVEPLLDNFARDMKAISSSVFQIDTKVTNRATPIEPSESNDPMPTATFSCCDETIKHDGKNSELYCIICGNNTPVSA